MKIAPLLNTNAINQRQNQNFKGFVRVKVNNPDKIISQFQYCLIMHDLTVDLGDGTIGIATGKHLDLLSTKITSGKTYQGIIEQNMVECKDRVIAFFKFFSNKFEAIDLTKEIDDIAVLKRINKELDKSDLLSKTEFLADINKANSEWMELHPSTL